MIYKDPSNTMVTEAVSELAVRATATTVAKGVAKDTLYFNSWWHGNLAIAVAV